MPSPVGPTDALSNRHAVIHAFADPYEPVRPLAHGSAIVETAVIVIYLFGAMAMTAGHGLANALINWRPPTVPDRSPLLEFGRLVVQQLGPKLAEQPSPLTLVAIHQSANLNTRRNLAGTAGLSIAAPPLTTQKDESPKAPLPAPEPCGRRCIGAGRGKPSRSMENGSVTPSQPIESIDGWAVESFGIVAGTKRMAKGVAYGKPEEREVFEMRAA